MPTRRIFISSPIKKRLSEKQRRISDAIVKRLKAEKLTGQAFDEGGIADRIWSAEDCFEVMRKCQGAVLIGFPRWSSSDDGNPVKLTTEFLHYEGVLARAMRLPILTIIEEGVEERGIIQRPLKIPEQADESWVTSQTFELHFQAWLRKLNARHDIFLGYCSKASPIAATISKHLRKIGVSIRDWKKDFRHGYSVIDEIESAAWDCSCAIANTPSLSRFHLPISPEVEAAHVRRLAREWDLQVPISSVGGLREGISARVRILQSLTVRASYLGGSVSSFLHDYPFLTCHFLDDCSSFAEFLSIAYGFQFKLSLCFDEIEIAPNAIGNSILKMPRSIDQRFLVKFSAAPYVGVASEMTEATDPTQRQDYRFVLLSSFSAKETRRFSESLFNSLAQKREISRSSDEVLGPSLVDDGTASKPFDHSVRYANKGPYQKKFSALYEKDRSFAEYADAKGIDVTDLSIGNENQRAALIRKIIWPVLIREEFLFQPESVRASTRRIRTVHPISDIYTGAASLFALCEGNPRQIIGLMEPMLRAYTDQELPGETRPVKRSLQKQLVQKMISAYFALVFNRAHDRANLGHSLAS